MNKTLKISFSLKNTYRVNTILYSLKQIPLIKRLLPDMLYRSEELKLFANVVSVLWEIVSVFLGKVLYLLIMVCGAGVLYGNLPGSNVFLHILLFLTIIGSFANTTLFNPSKDKYYAIILMRMNARDYTLVNYTYAMLKVVVGFLPFTILFGMLQGVPLLLCLLLPFSIAGCKFTVAALSLRDYEKNGNVFNENKLKKYAWLLMALLLGAAYGLPAAGLLLPEMVSAAAYVAFVITGVFSIRKIYSFQYYPEMNKELLAQMTTQMDTAVQVTKAQTEKRISTDSSITSNRKGFEYLNELFIRRHKKILWRSANRIAGVCAVLVCGVLLAMSLRPEIRRHINEAVMNFLPYFAFIMYCINRGTGFTQALFMNCDHSLLTYSFYKQPGSILRLFQIRLREIMKINAVPAAVIGTGLALILYASGGTEHPVNYLILIVSILGMSMFFSVHYLTVYYLLQPYNVGTELKSGMYKVIMCVTYFCCYFLMQLRMSTEIFGMMTIIFCVIYCAAACVLVYRFAPRTFRLRM